jgi:hypothetical protein
MYGFGSTGELKRYLSTDDIEGIQYIYGSGGTIPEFLLQAWFTERITLPDVNVSLPGLPNKTIQPVPAVYIHLMFLLTKTIQSLQQKLDIIFYLKANLLVMLQQIKFRF